MAFTADWDLPYGVARGALPAGFSGSAMPHSYGTRARTRSMFSRDYKKNGVNPLSIYMKMYKVGDYVDVKANPSIQKGMPFKGYHGRTGVVFNVTKRALGVVVNKQVNGRIIKKKINVRVEHVRPSQTRKEWIARVQNNERVKRATREGGERVELKRLPSQPKPGRTVKPEGDIETIQAIPFVDLL